MFRKQGGATKRCFIILTIMILVCILTKQNIPQQVFYTHSSLVLSVKQLLTDDRTLSHYTNIPAINKVYEILDLADRPVPVCVIQFIINL